MKTPSIAPQPFQIVRPGIARKDLNSDNIDVPPRKNFYLRYQAWTYRIGNQIGQFFFRRQHIRHSPNMFCSIFDAFDESAARGVRERNQAFQDSVRRSQVALEFESYPCVRNGQIVRWSGRRESNPRIKLGKLAFFH